MVYENHEEGLILKSCLKRDKSILLAIDPVHRSLLYSNLQYDDDEKNSIKDEWDKITPQQQQQQALNIQHVEENITLLNTTNYTSNETVNNITPNSPANNNNFHNTNTTTNPKNNNKTLTLEENRHILLNKMNRNNNINNNFYLNETNKQTENQLLRKTEPTNFGGGGGDKLFNGKMYNNSKNSNVKKKILQFDSDSDGLLNNSNCLIEQENSVVDDDKILLANNMLKNCTENNLTMKKIKIKIIQNRFVDQSDVVVETTTTKKDAKAIEHFTDSSDDDDDEEKTNSINLCSDCSNCKDDDDDDDDDTYEETETGDDEFNQINPNIPTVQQQPLKQNDENTTISIDSNSSNDSQMEYFDCHNELPPSSPPQQLNSSSSFYEDTTSEDVTSSASSVVQRRSNSKNIPLIQIVQEISAKCQVKSTVHVNREKVRKFTGHPEPIKIAASKKRVKSRQKIAADNFCNEILDKTLKNRCENESDGDNDLNVKETNNNSLDTSFNNEFVKFGQLKARPRYSDRTMSKLMEKRLERSSELRRRSSFDEQIIVSNEKYFQIKKTNFDGIRDDNKRLPPTKPPRTFASVASSLKNSSDGQHSRTTVAMEDVALAATRSIKKIGWQTPTDEKLETFPIKPNQQIGWIQPTDEIFNMLNYDEKNSQTLTANLKPEPQVRRSQPPKEDIDMVDGGEKRSRNLDRFLTESSMSSTPLKRSETAPASASLARLPRKPLKSDEVCKKCKLKIIKPNPETRNSFGKSAMKKTKHFFESSAHKILGSGSKSKSKTKSSQEPTAPSESEDDSNNRFDSPYKSEVTAQFNKDSENDTTKQSVKPLDLTPVKQNSDENNEMATTTKSAPPQKPIRKSLLSPKPQDEHDFDFQRIIDSPKRDPSTSSAATLKRSFKLTPKKLFKNFNKAKDPPTSPHPDDDDLDTYKSFIQIDDVPPDPSILSMNKYLQEMCEKIQENDNLPESEPTIDHKPWPRMRQISNATSCDALDYVPAQQQVEIDLHTEPIYAEIGQRKSKVSPHRFAADNNPNAIYTHVLKKSQSLDDVDRPPPLPTSPPPLSSRENLHQSLESVRLEDPQIIGTDLADSIQNFLDNMKIEKEKFQKQHYSAQLGAAAAVIDETDGYFERPTYRKEFTSSDDSDFVQSSSPPSTAPPPLPDNISLLLDTSFRTDSLCNSVVRGDSVNRNIANMINQFDQIDSFDITSAGEYRSFRQALPESDFDDDEAGSRNSYTQGSLVDDLDAIVLMDQQSIDEDDEPAAVVLRRSTRMDNIDVVDSPLPPALPTAPCPTTTTKIKSSTNVQQSAVKLLKDKLRNSFTRSSKNKSDRDSKSEEIRELSNQLAAATSMIEISDKYMLKLTNQISYQREIRKQLKNAIEVCRNKKEFECSTELVEAERLLLLSDKKELCAKNELIRIDYDDEGLTASPAKCSGQIAINFLEISLKREQMYDTFFDYYYICLCSYRDQVLATYARKRSGDKVVFQHLKMVFNDLEPSFEINIEVYALRLRKTVKIYSHESKFHLNKEDKKSPLSPSKLFHTLSAANATSPNKVKKSDSDVSRFRLQGNATITAFGLTSNKFEIADEEQTTDSQSGAKQLKNPNGCVYWSSDLKSFNFTLNEQNQNINGPMLIGFNSEIRLDGVRLQNYLNIADGNFQNWNRYWCSANRCLLNFWNNPNDECDKKPPILSIDLKKCINETIQLANRKLCAMPRTFMLEIFNSEIVGTTPKDRLNKYFIATNDNNELILWLTELNKILKFIKDWNI